MPRWRRLGSKGQASPLVDGVPGSAEGSPGRYPSAMSLVWVRVLWDIMATFVRLGFDVGSVLPRFKEASENAPDAVEQITPTHEFNVAVDDSTNEEE